jgi:peptidoglycan/xylan/chitin deacetylase (PgdA/CDA1 family)
MSRSVARRPSAAILVYHSIAEVEHDPFKITVAPEDFRRHMEIVARRFAPLRLSQLCAGLDSGELPERAVAVTFDDGYANNLSAALPSLAENGVPAALFVATGYIGSPREFWWDEVERLVHAQAGGDREPALELSAGEDSLHCSMSDAGDAIREIIPWLQGRGPGGIEAGLQQLRRWAGLDAAPTPRETHRPLKLEELRELARSETVEIAAHTRSHLRLGAQSEAVQRDEIDGSRADLQTWLGSAPASFAYPFGSPAGDYSSATVELVRELGFDRALTSSPSLAAASSPRYELPRYFVSTPAPEQFERWLGNRFKALPARAASKLVRLARGVGG